MINVAETGLVLSSHSDLTTTLDNGFDDDDDDDCNDYDDLSTCLHISKIYSCQIK